MALDAAQVIRKLSRVAFAAETTTGTLVSLTNTHAVTPTFNATFTASHETRERAYDHHFSAKRTDLGAAMGTISFQTELFGGESLPYWATTLLPACGMPRVGTSRVFAPSTASAETASMAIVLSGGYATQISGARGTFQIVARRGQCALIEWTFSGKLEAGHNLTIARPTYVSTIAPRLGASAFTIGGATYRCDQVTLDWGAVVEMREDITGVDAAGNATGYRAARIADRRTRVRCAPEALALATKDWFAAFRTQASAALALDIGADDNGVEIRAPGLQLVEFPAESERAGAATQELVFSPLEDSTGDDDFTIEFTEGA